MENYDPKSISISFGGKTINDGIADGTFVSLTRTNRTSTLRVGSDGGATRVINNARDAAVEITYRMSAKVNDTLRDIQQNEDAGIYSVGSFKLEDLNGRTIVSEANAFLDGPPDMEYSQEEPSRVWRILLPNPKIDNRGNDEPARIPVT